MSSRKITASWCAAGFLAMVSEACGPNEELGRSTQYIINASSTNYRINGSLNASEVSAAFAVGSQGSNQRWVVGFNNFTAGNLKLAGWAYSSDATGTSWTAASMSSALSFGNPGTSPYSGQSFAGWCGDPSLTAVTDSTINNSGQRILYTNVGCSGTPFDYTDAVIAYSDDGGQTWGNAQYVNTATSGGDVDNPTIATNAASPYHTYVAWQGGGGTWINSVSFSSGGTFTRGTPVALPYGGSGYLNHPAIAVGQWTACGGGVHEVVYVAYTFSGAARCPFDGLSHIDSNQKWYLVAYDVSTATWSGPWMTANDTAWPNCVGSGYLIDNDPRPRLAVDRDSSHFYVLHTQSHGNYGTRIQLDWGSFACVSGSMTPTFNHWTDEVCDPNNTHCQPDGTGLNDNNGNPIIQDEWGPSIAFTYASTTPRIAMSWMTTRDDSSNLNKFASVYGAYSESTSWSASPTAQGGSLCHATGTDVVPWNQTTLDWSDYQGIGIDPYHGNFLVVWGGDHRRGNTTSDIYTNLLQ